MKEPPLRPTIFLDYDNLANQLTGGKFTKAWPHIPLRPAENLLHPESVEAFRWVMPEFYPVFAIMTTWETGGAVQELAELMKSSALRFVGTNLTTTHEMHQPGSFTRSEAMSVWLQRDYDGEPFVILDPPGSDSDLADSALATEGRVVQCELGPSLTAQNFAKIRAALSTPGEPRNPARLVLHAFGRPIVFLDFDDVIVLNENKYGGYDAIAPNPPPDLWDNLFHPPAVDILRTISDDYAPVFVITTSWLQFLHPEGLVQILHRCGLAFVADNLHAQPEAPFTRGRTRADAITTWLQAHHGREPYVILDDKLSGTGLNTPAWRKSGRVVLCDEKVGLLPTHVLSIRRALTTPFKRSRK